jgi:hypothetical protein
MDYYEQKREQIEREYENLINNERKFAEIRRNIERGATDGILKDLEGFYKNVRSNTKILGKSISQNFLDMLNNIKSGLHNYKSIFFGGSESPSSSKKNDSKKEQSSNKKESEKRYHIIKQGDTLWELAEKYYGDGNKWTKIRDVNKGVNPNKLKVGQKLLIPFDTGGYTGDNVPKEGALAILHKKELVLNQTDTSKILETVKIAKDIFNNIKLPKIDIPTLKLPTPALAGNTYNINIHVDRITGDEKGANIVFSKIVKGIKTLGGDI